MGAFFRGFLLLVGIIYRDKIAATCGRGSWAEITSEPMVPVLEKPESGLLDAWRAMREFRLSKLGRMRKASLRNVECRMPKAGGRPKQWTEDQKVKRLERDGNLFLLFPFSAKMLGILGGVSH